MNEIYDFYNNGAEIGRLERGEPRAIVGNRPYHRV